MSSPAEPTETSSPDFVLSRRAVLGAGIGGLALASAACSGGGGGGASIVPPVEPPTPTETALDLLVARTTYGHDAATLARARAIGHTAFLEEQLAPEAIDDSASEARLAALVTLGLSSKQNYDQFYATGHADRVASELRAATLLRAAWSKRQLFERMVEFWTDHFSVDQSDSLQNVLKTQDDRDVIRAHALGNFRDLLRANAHGSAMSFYLGNYRNTATNSNENYGREIMELHTLGVGNYTEADVKAVARCFTGWSFHATNTPNFGGFVFRPERHDDGVKQVLGTTIPAGLGQQDGEIVIDMLVEHPATARFLALKLCRWFLAYDPPQDVVDATAAAYTNSGGDVRAMLRVVLSPEAMTKALARPRKLKRPFHLAASILRALNVTVTDPMSLAAELRAMGHESFQWPSPNGYPDAADAWGMGLLTRWAFVSRLFAGEIDGTSVAVANVFERIDPLHLAEHAASTLAGERFRASEVAAIQAYVDGALVVDLPLQREVLALTASAPSFQSY